MTSIYLILVGRDGQDIINVGWKVLFCPGKIILITPKLNTNAQMPVHTTGWLKLFTQGEKKTNAAPCCASSKGMNTGGVKSTHTF